MDLLGKQRKRSWLVFQIGISVVSRFGHLLEPDDPGKFCYPGDNMLYLGAVLDLRSEELVFDSEGTECKRVLYLAALCDCLLAGGLTAKALTSLAFKMLVVCECCPFSRQWLHPVFQALRGDRTSYPAVLQRV